jgi:hypothetical protein
VVDDATLETQKYKLVMVGRAVTEDEEHHHMLEHAAQGQHILSTDVFHESGEKFKKNITKDEGILKHYMRHIYLLFGLIFGVTTVMKAYQWSFQLLPLYEDYLDWVIFEHVKRGRSLEKLGKVFYENDRYSIEGRTN